MGALLSVVLVTTLGGIGVAQSFYGGVRGTVRDATGTVEGVTLTLTSDSTGVVLTTVSNAVGEYVFANTPPGAHTLASALSGYKTFERRGLLIGTQQVLVMDVMLEIGEVAEQIVVTGETPALDRSGASVASLIDRSALENLPSTGRNPFLLSTTVANVIPVGTPFFTRMQDQNASSLLSIAGAPPRANTYLLDGVPITDLLNRAAIVVSEEALEEVSVQVSSYDAAFGRSGGGVFNSTHRAGASAWRGSALLRNRPDWGLANTFFARQTGRPRPESYNYLWAGALGGPIVPGRTFFFSTTEGYRTREIRERVLTLPTALERTGDFSRSVDAGGRPIVIYDPRTTRDDPGNPGQSIRDPFPGNIIPPDRIDPVARELMRMYPLPDAARSSVRTGPVSDVANQITTKIDHQLMPSYRLSGTAAWYGSREPDARVYDGLASDPGLGQVVREVRAVALNHLFTPGGATVYEARYGYLSFRDDSEVPGFDMSLLGFTPRFTAQVPVNEFPAIVADGYSSLGAGFSRRLRFPSHTVNGTITRLVGRHTVKIGGDYRRLGLGFDDPGASGFFQFSRALTQGPNPRVAAANAGDPIASLLLGLPAIGRVRVGTALDFNAHYYAAYVQDDVRIGPQVTLNLGVRYEFESGLRETRNQFTVGFDRERASPVQVPGLTLRGGLMFAGVDGYPTRQSDPNRTKLGPRAGISWALGDRTVVRGGYGLFWGPHQFQFPSEDTLGTRGFSETTDYFGTADGLRPCEGCVLNDPFPNGIGRPQGNLQGLVTGAGGDIHFNDQFRRSPYLHKYSIDLQRELPHSITLKAGYIGSRAEHLDVSGSTAAAVNINQLDPSYQALGSALNELVPNPFHGQAVFGAFATQPLIARGQLLRPYPQFGNVFAHQVSAGRSRYHSLVLEGRRRVHNGWGAGVNYTWSRTDDNIVGELNAFSERGTTTQLVLNNYDLDAEFGRSLADVPHRLNVTATVDLPFGARRRWLAGRGVLSAIAGGWSVTVVGFHQSGFPIRVVQSDANSGLMGSSQRPNIVPGVDPYAAAAGEYDPACRCVPWLNPAAWSAAPPFTFGNAPRVDPRLRTPSRNNWSAAIQKTGRWSAATITVRAEVINVLNDADLTGPAIVFPLPNFGQIGGSGGVARTVQLMVRGGF